MAKKYWLCRCGTRWPRTTVKCAVNGCNGRRPKARRQPHMKALDNSYEAFRDFNERVHGPAFGPEWQPDDCGCCGKPPGGRGNHDRDHGHRKGEHSYGKMRGLACPGHGGCNMKMKGFTARELRLMADYMERAERANELEEAA